MVSGGGAASYERGSPVGVRVWGLGFRVETCVTGSYMGPRPFGGTDIIKNPLPMAEGPHHRPMLRVLWWSEGGICFDKRGTLVLQHEDPALGRYLGPCNAA